MDNARGQKCRDNVCALSRCVSKWLISHVFFLYFPLLRIWLFGKSIMVYISLTGLVYWMHDYRIWIDTYVHRGYSLITKMVRFNTKKITIKPQLFSWKLSTMTMFQVVHFFTGKKKKKKDFHSSEQDYIYIWAFDD